MAVLKTIVEVVFIIVCIFLTVVILLQEGKSAGLGAISGAADTYWGKNKGRSMEAVAEAAAYFCNGEDSRWITNCLNRENG